VNHERDKIRIRVLLTKGFLDGHDRGVLTVARALRDAGMEVIHTNFAVPDEIVRVAVQEDVDVIGLSFSCGGQLAITEEVFKLIRQEGLKNMLVIVGGSFSPDDAPKLIEMGVGRVFMGGSRLGDIVDYLAKNAVGAQHD
jgi:methylmalonyl-CoA mutase C-terminal domain/subunit